MPPNPEVGDFIALEIRLLDRAEAGYPIEMTLTNTQQVFRGQLAADMLPWAVTGNTRADGQRLFDALFTNNPDLREGWGVAKGKSNRRRLRLRIDAVELNTLPWELLCDKIDLLAADADTPFSRYLAVSREWGTAIKDRPIRVLAVISNPIDLKDRYPDLEPADVEAEMRALKDAIGSTAQLDFLAAPVTLDRLETELRKGYHILHFIGHGAFSEKMKQAALYLQDATGNVQRVFDVDFAGMLNRLQVPPHLVVLAACQSAQQSTSAAFTGLGPQLVQIGLPAVIAMQENVTVVTARQFAATFYQRLLAHGTVDLAMNEARGTLITNGRFDAAVPVLFMRLPDGRLWDVEKQVLSPELSQRFIDAALPNEVSVGSPAELLVIVRLPNSAGLRALLKIDPHEVQAEDVHSRPFEIDFPHDHQGRLCPAPLTIILESDDFEIKEKRKKIEVPVNRDSPLCTFFVTPRHAGQLRILVQAVSERDSQIGSAILHTNGSKAGALNVLVHNLATIVLGTRGTQAANTRSADMADEDSKSRSGGVNISGKTKVGGGIYQADKISKIDNRTTTRSGGTDINARGGTVNITGDVVGRDKITTTITNTGLSAADFAKAFDVIYQKVATKPAEDQADIRDAIDAIKAEAKKEAVEGKPPDEKMVKLSAQALVTTAPDLLRDVADVVLATLASPANGVLTVIRKVLEKARA